MLSDVNGPRLLLESHRSLQWIANEVREFQIQGCFVSFSIFIHKVEAVLTQKEMISELSDLIHGLTTWHLINSLVAAKRCNLVTDGHKQLKLFVGVLTWAWQSGSRIHKKLSLFRWVISPNMLALSQTVWTYTKEGWAWPLGVWMYPYRTSMPIDGLPFQSLSQVKQCEALRIWSCAALLGTDAQNPWPKVYQPWIFGPDLSAFHVIS